MIAKPPNENAGDLGGGKMSTSAPVNVTLEDPKKMYGLECDILKNQTMTRTPIHAYSLLRDGAQPT